jgi:hypothetical protein
MSAGREVDAWTSRNGATRHISIRRTPGAHTNHGGNAGVWEADYYWSEADNQWVPPTQIYIVQTIVGVSDVGSGSVYWEEALPASSGNDLYVAQMRYDSKTNTMQSLWLVNWVYGPSFADGDSWVVQMPDQTQKGWTVYTPAQ